MPPDPSAAGGGSQEPEICLDYEESPAADLTLHTHVEGHWSAVDRTIRLAWRLLLTDPGDPHGAERRPRC